MIYKDFGKTGEKISSLGFGCMRFPMIKSNGSDIVDEEKTSKIIHRAYELGVNYFDSGYFYCEGLSEIALGKALKNIRKDILLSTKCPGDQLKKPGDCRRIIEDQLRKLNVDFIDFYHFHGIGYDNFYDVDKRAKWISDVQKAKAEGLIKHISFSFHDEPDNMMKLVDTGLFESVLCQYSAIERQNEDAIAYAKAKGLGVAIMGPLGGGRVSGMPKDISKKLNIKINSSAELALRFVLSNQNVDCALSGMSDIKMVEENAATASNSYTLSDDEIKSIKLMMIENEKLAQLYCTGCSYCMPCPSGVNIPFIFIMMNYKRIYGIDSYAKDGYSKMGEGFTRGNNATSCKECGACEKKCPQKLHIIEQLKESHAALSK